MASISAVKGVGPTMARGLAKLGYDTPGHLARAAPADIVVVSGIGDARAKLLIAAAQAWMAANAAAPKSVKIVTPDAGEKRGAERAKTKKRGKTGDAKKTKKTKSKPAKKKAKKDAAKAKPKTKKSKKKKSKKSKEKG